MSEARMRVLLMAVLAGSVAAGCGTERDASEMADTVELTPPDSGAATADTVSTMAPGSGAVPGLSPMIVATRPGDDDTVVTGVVRSVGADPFAQTVLRTPAGDVGVRGRLAPEIAGLLGAEVRAWGTPVPHAPPPPQRAVDVRGYEIVSVNGERPVVGTLVADGAALVTAAGDTVRLAGVPQDLAWLPGATVWVVGVERGEGLAVQSYGVIRRPQ